MEGGGGGAGTMLTAAPTRKETLHHLTSSYSKQYLKQFLPTIVPKFGNLMELIP